MDVPFCWDNVGGVTDKYSLKWQVISLIQFSEKENLSEVCLRYGKTSLQSVKYHRNSVIEKDMFGIHRYCMTIQNIAKKISTGTSVVVLE